MKAFGVLAAAGLVLVLFVTAAAGTSRPFGDARFAGAVFPREAASSVTFADPAGDAGAAADITKIVVSDDAASGMLSFAVNASGMQPHSRLNVWLNTDMNVATGNASGHDYVAYYWLEPGDEWGWHIERWDGKKMQELPLSQAMGFDRSGDLYTWTMSKDDLGGTNGFRFSVNSALRDASHKTVLANDKAPNSGANWIYYLLPAAPPTPTTPEEEVIPVIGKPVAVPATAIVGKRMSVSFVVTRSTDGARLTGGRMICDPSVAGRPIRHSEQFKNGIARVAFTVPVAARGKLLKVKVTITLAGRSATRLAVFRIRTT